MWHQSGRVRSCGWHKRLPPKHRLASSVYLCESEAVDSTGCYLSTPLLRNGTAAPQPEATDLTQRLLYQPVHQLWHISLYPAASVPRSSIPRVLAVLDFGSKPSNPSKASQMSQPHSASASSL